MGFHIDFLPAKADSFGFQSESLLDPVLSVQFQLAAGTEYALPWKSDRAAKYARHLSCGSGNSRSASHRAVSRDPAARNLPNHSANAGMGGSRGAFQMAIRLTKSGISTGAHAHRRPQQS
jgi:hypothetical protein